MILAPEKGRILISEPFLEDPNFSRTVVFLTEYSAEGSVGYVLNQATDFKVNELIAKLAGIEEMVFHGGPVEVESFHYIHTYAHITGAIEVSDGVFWSGDFDEIQAGIIDRSLDIKNFKFFIGYSGWASGQLEEELKEQTWIVSSISKELLFNPKLTDEQLWRSVMTSMGGDFALLANSPINPQYN